MVSKKTTASSSSLPILNVVIVGHIDHGKTTLLQKLSGKWTDTHSEELKRGITIKLGYADIVLSEDRGNYNREGKGIPVRHVSFVDAPGHEMLMATMLSGAAIVDAAILVVSAKEGIQPQTREHFLALQAKRIPHVIVVQNKIDVVQKEQALANYADIKALLGKAYASAPIIPVSAQQEVHITEIYRALAEIPPIVRPVGGDPIFLVARSFDVNKPGTTPEKLAGAVLGGTLRSGTLSVGQKLEIKPGILVKEANQYHYKPLTAIVRKLFNGSTSVASLTPGGSMSIETTLDMSLAKNDALAGCMAAPPKLLPDAQTSVKLAYTLFPSSAGTPVEPLKASEMVLLSIGTSMAVGVIKRLTASTAEVTLKIPTIVFSGDNVAISRQVGGHWRLVGYGTAS
ncbi:translation initiation factor IF-2 subunit gamma [Candidatus Pacearchaeota archaeon]|nr:translation initiation factor IF-2 subunit gamma [Candidatus Pacearchaeota archaeon]